MSNSPLALYASPEAFRQACEQARQQGKRVGLVPTMGALHQGHFSLIQEAKKRADFVAVSIFVNPTQFGPTEDLANYPRTLERDRQGCEKAGADCIFAPSADAMYLPGEQTRVQVSGLTDFLCGPRRPGHFEGVATVVTKLFALAGPCVAVFGRKDYQQFQVIKRMAKDLFLPVEVVGHRTVREPDGLAMSSRNAYLSPEERARAQSIPQSIRALVKAFEDGERSAGQLRALVRQTVSPVVESIDYIELTDPETLVPWQDSDRVGERTLMALAVRLGRARLIDNVVLGEEPAPCAKECP